MLALEGAEQKASDIRRFLDEKGRVTAMPSKRTLQSAVLAYLAEKFEPGRDYTEKEVNAVCAAWHTFGDFYRVRRDLVDHGFLARERDGSRYWRRMPEEDGVRGE